MSYRNQRNCENLNKAIYPGEGKYGIPRIEPTQFKNCDFIGFNYASSCKDPQGKGVHFFLDDYQFNRVWTTPDRYIDLLEKFKYVLSPDFSTYTDFPAAIQIYNHYRKHWLAAYWQEQGIQVIPTISWSTEESFEWCFDGEPKHSTVAISSVGTQMSKDSKELFLNGYKRMIEILEPNTVIMYGSIPEACARNIVRIQSFQERFQEVVCDGRQGKLQRYEQKRQEIRD